MSANIKTSKVTNKLLQGWFGTMPLFKWISIAYSALFCNAVSTRIATLTEPTNFTGSAIQRSAIHTHGMVLPNA